MSKDIPSVLDMVAPELPNVWYDSSSGSGRFWMENSRGRWQPVSEKTVQRELIAKGFLKKPLPGEPLSQVEDALRILVHERSVDYAGPLAGYDSGHQTILNSSVLVTESAQRIEPAPGDFTVLRKVIECVLGDFPDQLHVFHGWMKIALMALKAGNYRPGQAMVFAGPKDCGKSFLQKWVITPLLGGRIAKPYRYMSGATDFNADLFGAEHLYIEDEVASSDTKSRRAFGAALKNVLVNEAQRCHPKNKQAFYLTPFWRISISVNDEAEDLMVLPPKDDSIWDKIILLRATRNDFPMPTFTDEERKAFLDAVIAGLPGYFHWLINEYQIPEQYVDRRRFGVISYHDPELLISANELSPDSRLLQLIDEVHFSESTTPLEGTAERLQLDMGAWEQGKREFAQLLGWQGAMKTYLKRLSQRVPDRVKGEGFGHNHKMRWTILPPKEEKP